MSFERTPLVINGLGERPFLGLYTIPERLDDKTRLRSCVGRGAVCATNAELSPLLNPMTNECAMCISEAVKEI